jgi:hypothetical protein
MNSSPTRQAAAGQRDLFAHKTGRERILELFENYRCNCPEDVSGDLDRCRHCVPLTRILDLRIAQYNTRISELRELGHAIQNFTGWKGPIKHSWYVYRGKT